MTLTQRKGEQNMSDNYVNIDKIKIADIKKLSEKIAKIPDKVHFREDMTMREKEKGE